MTNSIITISNLDKNQFFFTTDHCQPHNLGDKWVSCTQYRTTREAVKKQEEEGINEWARCFEIPNPQPEYQA